MNASREICASERLLEVSSSKTIGQTFIRKIKFRIGFGQSKQKVQLSNH